MAGVLELRFDTEQGKTVTLSINDPKPDLTSSEVETVMQTIINSNIFHHEGNPLVGIKQARIVERNITTFDIG